MVPLTHISKFQGIAKSPGELKNGVKIGREYEIEWRKSGLFCTTNSWWTDGYDFFY